MHLNIQARRSEASFNEWRNITKTTSERNAKSAANNIHFPNGFEFLNCETTENYQNYQL